MSNDINVGDVLKLTKDIWDDGQDYHPPGYLARKGELVVVHRKEGKGLAVAHKHVKNSVFLVFPDEYEWHAEGLPST